MKRKHRNPSFPTGLVVGAVLGAGALAWWLTRKPATSATQAVTDGRATPWIGQSPGLASPDGCPPGTEMGWDTNSRGGQRMCRPVAGIEPNREYLADGSMSYADTAHPLYNPPPGSVARPLTLAEIAAIQQDPTRPLLPAEQAMLLQQRAAAAAREGRID